MMGTNLLPDQTSPQDTWDRLLKQTETFAAEQAAVRWWRHAHDGVMPDGYDPNSIAAQAVTDLLKTRRPDTDQIRELKRTPRAMRNLQKRLNRKFLEFVKRQSSEKLQNSLKKS